MIYIETITDNGDLFRIERQKDHSFGNWYGVSLILGLSHPPTKHDCILSDNDEYIIGALYYTLRDNPKEASEELNYQLNKDDIKLLLKLIRKADKLGWFDETRKRK